MSNAVRVRIAPSPTGYVHVGNLYTAYYNYVFAKQQKGTFILRLDDTDLERHVADAEELVYSLFSWFGLTWEEGPNIGGSFSPYRQSERLDRYQSAAQQLVEKGLAYPHEGAVFLKLQEGADVEFVDLIKGHVAFKRETLKDFVIIKSNGYPTYQFATVVDEIDHQITHVIRAEDHLSNTAVQLLAFEALQAQPPQYAHLPLLRNEDSSKLSKRQNHTSVRWFKEQGYLPATLKNFFALLGWSHPEGKEIFSEEEFIQLFSFDDVNSSAPVFDLVKLNWMNGMYIRELSVDELVSRLLSFYQETDETFYRELTKIDTEFLASVVALEQERLVTLAEFKEKTGYFFQEDFPLDVELLDEFIESTEIRQAFVAGCVTSLQSLSEWSAEAIEHAMREVQSSFDLKPKQAFMTLRLLVTGQKATPSLFHVMEVLPKETVITRLNRILA